MMSELTPTIVPNVNHHQSGYMQTQPKSVDASTAVIGAPKVEVDREPLLSTQDLQDKIGQLNELMVSGKRAVFFTVDAATGKDVVTVTNLTTGDLIRQIPTAEALKAMKNMDTMMGLIFNQKT